MRPLPLLLALVLLAPALGCATARRHPHEARFLAVSAADAVTTWAAIERGAVELNPIYGGSDALTVAATSLALSAALTVVLHRVLRGLPPRQRKQTWLTATAVRGLGIPFNLNNLAHAEEIEP